MAKAKIEPVFKEWDQVNEALREISEIDREVQKAEGAMNETINQIKTATESKVSPLLARRQELEKNIEQFTVSRVDEFSVSKTKNLTFGKVGFRKTTSLITRNVKAIIEAIKQNKMVDCLKISVTIDKEELAKYDDKSLEKVGARRKTEDKFFYEPSVERIEA